MRQHLQTLVTIAAIACLAPAAARAQAAPQVPKDAAAPGAPQEVVPVKVQVVLSRYLDDKKISSMPYTLAMNAGGRGQPGVGTLRMGAKIPIKMMLGPVVDGKPMPAGGPIQYQDVGTNIDCRMTALGDGKFDVGITIDDTSVYGEAPGKTSDQPSFRSFRATNALILRDGQTGQFTSAVDKVSGEVTRVDVTVTVVK